MKKYLIRRCDDCNKWHIWKRVSYDFGGIIIRTGSYRKLATFDTFWDRIIFMLNLTDNDLVTISETALKDDNILACVMEYNEVC